MAKLIPSSNYSEPQQQQQQFLQITQHDKFYSRLLSKESSLANPSLRVYYGGASGAVPFVWESRPGTPKRTAAANPLPPLTPPPSYHFNHHTKNNNKKPSSKNPTKSILIQSILPRPPKKNPNSRQSRSSSSGSLSSTSTSSSSGSETSSSSSRTEAEESVDGGSTTPTSTLRGCYSMLAMKNVLLAIVGGGRHGSS